MAALCDELQVILGFVRDFRQEGNIFTQVLLQPR